jgi:hypothetical protein
VSFGERGELMNTILAWIGCYLMGQQLGLIYVLTHDRRQVPDPLVMAAFLTECVMLPGLFG